MPLVPGNNQEAISQNIHELTTNGSKPRSHEQIVAIALSNARKTGKVGMKKSNKKIGMKKKMADEGEKMDNKHEEMME